MVCRHRYDLLCRKNLPSRLCRSNQAPEVWVAVKDLFLSYQNGIYIVNNGVSLVK